MLLVQIGCRNSNLTLTPKPEKKILLERIYSLIQHEFQKYKLKMLKTKWKQ